jgi:hypothetical protein
MIAGSTDFKRIALGAAGGLVGTLAIQSLLAASQKRAPSTLPPIREDPGKFMVERAERVLPAQVRRRVPHAAETAMAKVLGMGYGVSFGALYAGLRPRVHMPIVDGFLLGVAAWAAGYLGWLPALGLMPPVWKHKPKAAAAQIAEHAAYGLATVATIDWLAEHV